MAEKIFTAGEAVGYGWSKVKEKFWFWGAVSITISLISGIGSELAKRMGENTAGALVVNIIFSLISIVLSIGAIKLSLKAIDGEPLEYKEIFVNGKYFLNYLLASIIIALIVIGGLILLIIPGIYWAIKYQYTTYLIVDKNMPIGEAMRKSGEMTKGQKLNLFWLGIVFIGVILLGVIALVIGVIWATAVVWIAAAYVYRKLLKASETQTAPAAEPAPAQ